MLGLAAAPEIAIAVPSERPLRPPYSSLRRKALQALPACSALAVKDSALRSCHDRWCVETMLSAMLTTWNGRQSASFGQLPSWCRRGHSDDITGLSSSSKPLNASGLRLGRDEPRKARTSRLR